MTYRRLSLTDLVVKIQRGARNKTARKVWGEEGVDAKWEATSRAKKIAAQKRKATMSDFDRFKKMVSRKK